MNEDSNEELDGAGRPGMVQAMCTPVIVHTRELAGSRFRGWLVVGDGRDNYPAWGILLAGDWVCPL